jgi:predicted small secreted protein
MKNFLKIIGIIAMVAVIGFSMAACEDDNGGDDSGSSGGAYKGPEWPAEFLFAEGLTNGNKVGDWGVKATGYMGFRGQYTYNDIWNGGVEAWMEPRLTFSKTGAFADTGTSCNLVSVAGKTIKIKGGATKDAEITLCTDWSITDGKLTLTGGADASAYHDKVIEMVPAGFFTTPLAKME